MALRGKEQRARATAAGPTAFEAPGLRQLPPPPTSPPREIAPSPLVGQTPRPEKQATSAEHPGLLAPMIRLVAETLHNPPRLAQHQREEAQLDPVGGRLRGDGVTQTTAGTANYVLDDKDLL